MKDGHEHNDAFCNVAKSLRYLPKLQYFYRRYALEASNEHVEKELRTYSKATSRLKDLKKVVYNLDEAEQSGFQKAMKKNIAFPGITALKLDLSLEEPPNIPRFEPFLSPEASFDMDTSSSEESFLFDSDYESDHDEYMAIHRRYINELMLTGGINSDEEDSEENPLPPGKPQLTESDTDESIDAFLRKRRAIASDFATRTLMHQEVKPFYRFDLFPNLKKLTIDQEDYFFPLNPVIIKSFKALTQLEALKIDIASRSQDSNYLFMAFLKLPLLKKFSLHISFIKKRDWTILKKFVKKQENLQSFSLLLRNEPCLKHYFCLNEHLENIIKCLNDKPSLKSIDLRSNYWSLEALSKGLAHLKITNQIQKFNFRASDDTITSQAKARARIEGLCNFIKNQKESLKILHVFLPFSLDKSPVTYIGEALSKLVQLKKLYFSVNCGYENGISFFENTLQATVPAETRRKVKMPKKWNPNLAKHFKRLENLEHFELKFDIGHLSSSKWFVNVMKVLPDLKNLQKVDVVTDSGKFLEKAEQSVTNIVQEFKDLRRICVVFIHSPGFYKLETFLNLTQTTKKFNRKQSMRCDLMF